jgi:ankyrin repeat protein
MMAVFGNEIELVEAALLDFGVEIDAVNNLGSTALLYGAEEGRLYLIEMLLKNFPNANVNAVDKVTYCYIKHNKSLLQSFH